MKKTWIWIGTVLLAGAMTLPAQQGRGGEPQAFGDKDKDGICDVTGKPVGQGRMAAKGEGQGKMEGQCQGNCKRNRAGKGQMGRGKGRRGMRGQGQGAAANQEAPPAEEAK